MPEMPFTVSDPDPAKQMQQMMLLLQELYQDRIGGANLGDVFGIGDDDILSVRTDDSLEKLSSQLKVKIKAGGGLSADAGGIYSESSKTHLPISTGGGTSALATITGTASIKFTDNADTAYVRFRVPGDWDGTSDFIIKMMVQNESAETSGKIAYFAATVHGIADGETNADAGQAVIIGLALTGGDEAINKVNLLSGTIDSDHATYPITAGDTAIIRLTVSLAPVAGACTGPLHIIDWWIEF